MPITAVSSDGVEHEFPDGTDQAVIGKVMKTYALAHTAKPPEAKKADPTLMDKLGQAVTAPFKRIPGEIASEYHEGSEGYRTGMAKAMDAAKAGKPGDILAPIGSAVDAALSPISGTAHALLGHKLGDVAMLASPLGEEVAAERLLATGAKEAGVGVNTLRKTLEASKAGQEAPKAVNAAKQLQAHPDPEHAAAVSKLEAEGVQMTPGQRVGGMRRQLEEAHKSNPLVSQAIQQAEAKSIETFNVAAYNRALAPIGERFSGDKVGRDGIAQVEAKIGAAYDRLEPKLKIVPDHQLVDDLHEIKIEASDLPPPQQEQYEGIMKNRVIKRLETGEMDGKTFKQVESEIGHLSRGYKSSQDFAQRELGQRLEDTMGALRDNLERSSDPSVRDELKRTNSAWAQFVRLQGAANRRATSGGVFTPSDLLQAAKSADRSVRKGAFARGDALLQDLGEIGQRVLPNKLPDSGTATRMFANGKGLVGGAIGGAVGGLPGAAAGMAADMAAQPITNALARAYLQRGSPLTGRNYLSSVMRQSSALAPPRPAMLALPAAAVADEAGGQ